LSKIEPINLDYSQFFRKSVRF